MQETNLSISKIYFRDVTFGIDLADSGKTYLAAMTAIKAFKYCAVD